MKNIFLKGFLATSFVCLFSYSCSDKILDKIDTNPNAPVNVPINILMAEVTTDVSFTLSGTDLAWYSSIFVEHTAGVHAQFEQADRRVGINSSIGSNSWNSAYADIMNDLRLIIEKGSEGGSEAGSWTSVGIAKVLTAYTLGIVTDLWGKAPYSEALKGNKAFRPKFDKQEDNYKAIIKLLDDAIVDLSKTSVSNPGTTDLIYGGSAAGWTRAAYSLKARYHNRLSKRDPQGSATKALEAINNAFKSSSESMIFAKFTTSAVGEHPWQQEAADRSHFAVSKTFYDILNNRKDPRISFLFGTIGGQVRPAPNGTSINDQSAVVYSRASSNVVFSTATMPLITYDEVKFIEAEAQLRLGKTSEAQTAYTTAVTAAMTRVKTSPTDIAAYLAQPSVSNATQDNIITQKYISFWLFQPIEAYNDYRRTGIPKMNNPVGAAPRRFPYPQSEIDTNKENVPNVQLTEGVWWDTGVE
jgi:hypothetical protein